MSTLKKLQKATSLKEFADLLGYRPSALAYIVRLIPAADKYTKFEILKKSGGMREIHAPIEKLKVLQRRLANILYECRAEIEARSSAKRPLSHAYRRSLSIVTNAQQHKNRRYVLNLDIESFFPTINFGRVRGYFISNRDFKLHKDVATLIAQIACHEGALPQGSPCSPIISDLIGHLLDIRLVQLAKKHTLTYSRYADDLTFSTNKKIFPHRIAYEDGVGIWNVGADLRKKIEGAGFNINEDKTRMQCRISRQLVTGLTVNSKVNIRPEYYRNARAMADSLFKTGAYHVDGDVTDSLERLHGILSHIDYVKNISDYRDELEKKKSPTASRALYAEFLFFKYFVALRKPMIICEGKTDNVYIKYAIKYLKAYHPKLGEYKGKEFKLNISLFPFDSQANKVLNLNGGTGELNYLIANYAKYLKRYDAKTLASPVVILIDNDKGSREIFKTIKSAFKKDIDIKTPGDFFHLTDNLYLIKTPSVPSKADGDSYIEDFFPSAVLSEKVDGKIFNPDKKFNHATEYSKAVFADKVIRQKASAIDFSAFGSLLDRLVKAIDDYSV